MPKSATDSFPIVGDGMRRPVQAELCSGLSAHQRFRFLARLRIAQ